MIAEWRDGINTPLEEVTVGYYRAMQAAKETKAAGKRHEACQITHPVTKNVLTVKARADRHPLMSLFEQGAQIGQVRIAGFDDDPDKQMKMAAEFMKEVAKAYAADNFPISKLKDHIATQLGKVEGFERRLK